MNYIVFDLEATCWENNDARRLNEIIEIGAVKLNDTFDIIDEFSSYVRPTINSQLSPFCRKLTTICQVNVDSAPVFSEAMSMFENWIFSTGENVLLLSWGHYDRKQILREAAEKNYFGKSIQFLEEGHRSLKHEFAKVRHIKPCGMAKALQLLNLSLEGIHHRGIDDAKNIARIFRIVSHELEVPSKNLPRLVG